MLLTGARSIASVRAMAPLARIRAYMKKHGLSQRAFGERVGVSQGMVSQWLERRRPIAAHRAVEIEKKTKGELDRSQIRPDLFERGA